jgi:DNA-binding response OmpR family regulator
MSSDPVVLLALGEAQESDTIEQQLTLDGFEVRRAGCLAALRAHCVPGDVELIALGGAADQATSLGVLRALRAGELREVDPGTRVLWLGATGELAEVLRALAAGADDAMRAPVVYAELLARARAVLRRDLPAPSNISAEIVRYGPLQIDTVTRRVTFDGAVVDLRRLEYSLLVYLARDPGRVYTKRELLREVWGYRSEGSTRTIDSHVSRLRRKLTLAGADGWMINQWGVGYQLCTPEAHGALRLVAGGRSA